MGKFIKAAYDIPYKGRVESRKIGLYRSKEPTKDEFELELQGLIGCDELKVTYFFVETEEEFYRKQNATVVSETS